VAWLPLVLLLMSMMKLPGARRARRWSPGLCGQQVRPGGAGRLVDSD
jgi:hypothetical protein